MPNTSSYCIFLILIPSLSAREITHFCSGLPVYLLRTSACPCSVGAKDRMSSQCAGRIRQMPGPSYWMKEELRKWKETTQGMYKLQSYKLIIAVMSLYQRLAKRDNSQEDMRVLNEEIVSMISKVRTLEDSLLAEQYCSDVARRQAEEYRAIIDQLNAKRDMLEDYIVRASEELQLAKDKKIELGNCEKNLLDISKQLSILNEMTESKAQQTQQLLDHANFLERQNRSLSKRNAEISENEQRVMASLESICERNNIEGEVFCGLKTKISVLQKTVLGQKAKEEEERRELEQELRAQKERLMRLEYDFKLEQSRVVDQDRNQKLLQECLNEGNLEQIIEDMLVKEDELVEAIATLEKRYQSKRQHHQRTLHQISKQHTHTLGPIQGQIDSINHKNQLIRDQINLLTEKIQRDTHRYESIAMEKEIQGKINCSLAALKKLRDAEEKNKLLKRHRAEIAAQKELILREKEILFTQKPGDPNAKK